MSISSKNVNWIISSRQPKPIFTDINEQGYIRSFSEIMRGLCDENSALQWLSQNALNGFNTLVMTFLSFRSKLGGYYIDTYRPVLTINQFFLDTIVNGG